MKHLPKNIFYFKTEKELEDFKKKRNINNRYAQIAYLMAGDVEGFYFFISKKYKVLSLSPLWPEEDLYTFVDKNINFLQFLRNNIESKVQSIAWTDQVLAYFNYMEEYTNY